MIVMRHGDRMTLSEYRLTPENEGVWDLIDGVLEKQPLATLIHQMILGDLLNKINNYTSETDPPLGYGISNIGVAFSESFAPTPRYRVCPLGAVALDARQFYGGNARPVG